MIEIAKAVTRSGSTMSENDLRFTSDEVAQLILEEYHSLHIAELPLLIKCGVFGKFGDFYGVNAVSINSWIVGYLESDVRKRAVQEIDRISADRQLTQSVPLTPEREYSALRSMSAEMFNRYVVGSEWRDYRNFLYLFYEKLGLIALSTKDKWRLYNKAVTENPDDKHPKFVARTMAVEEFFMNIKSCGKHILDFIPEEIVDGYTLIEAK